MGRKIFGFILLIILGIILAAVGFFLWFGDGYCAGGSICSRAPGALAILGSLSMAFSVCQFLLITKLKYKNYITIISTIIIAIILFLIRYKSFLALPQ